jgi:predicted nucleic acid-binding protein
MKNMNLMIDANILIDVLAAREPFVHDSSLIWKMCETGIATGHVSLLTFANITYVMRKQLDPGCIEDLFNKLALIFSFEALTIRDVKTGALLEWTDFEDAIQFATASRIRADYIVTRNTKDYINSTIPAVTPTELIMLVS